ncbi:hypothetical protein L6452_03820 [Arctium lappa]|uniref:Uncharacterized protein n=1 Tax=Arctium lappa TaxID=4217 RepID=A0ACB9FPA5_ARCLA|nr:hypothetical protein L6452_03820 [Arctium lappa]
MQQEAAGTKPLTSKNPFSGVRMAITFLVASSFNAYVLFILIWANQGFKRVLSIKILQLDRVLLVQPLDRLTWYRNKFP